MAACTWTTLTGPLSAAGSVQRWVLNDSVDPEEIIAEAEDWLKDRLRVRFMMVRAPVTLAQGASAIDLSTEAADWLDPIEVWANGYGEIRNIPDFDLNKRRAVDTDGTLNIGTPTYYTVIGSTMYFDAAADQSYSLVLSYYGQVPALSSTNLTNLFTERYRSLFKKAVMGHAYIFLKDEDRAGKLLTAADQQASKIEETDDLMRRGQVTYTEVA